ncbi:MAG TPA: BON domain-containing protein [Terriglobales bacterium]|nr:BON domain-containing protein [Terriglobales bacterium]
MRIHKLTISIVLLTALLGLSIACSKKPSDDTIAKDIQTKIAADPDTKDSQVNVTAKEAKVTMTGQVKTPAAQQKIEQIAREEPGAAGVDDQTAVQPDASAAPAPAQAMAPPPPPVEKPKPQPIVVPSGTTLTITVGQALSSKTSQTGQTFIGTLAQPVSVGGRSAIPAGSTISGTVVSAKSKGKIKGQGELDLALTSVTVRGQTYNIQTAVVAQTVKGKGKRTAVATGGGAAGGALIGGIAGGGKGAGIGALVGAGAGLVGGTLTGNQQIEIPAESALSFRLSAPLTLPPPAE